MNSSIIELTKKHLFSTVEEMEVDHVPSNVRDRMLRLRDMYSYWLQYPRLGDKDIVAELRRRYHLGITRAYDDVRLIKICLGSLTEVTKEYHRYYFQQRCEEGFALARENKDANAFARVLTAYLKGTQLDKEDADRPDYSLIVPQQFTISVDPSVVGFKAVPNIMEKAKALEQKYIHEFQVNDFAEAEEIKIPKPIIRKKQADDKIDQ